MSEAVLDDDAGSNRRVTRQRNLSPDDAITKARQELELSNATLKRNNEQLVAHAERTGKAAADAELARITSEEQQINNGLLQAKTAETAARAAKLAAREAGNTTAEMDADDALTNAKVEQRILAEKKTYFDASKDAAIANAKALAEPPKQTVDTSVRDRWFSEHPLYNSDPAYKQDTTDGHNLALARGHRNGSPEYYGFIDQHLKRLHGDQHGRSRDQTRRQQKQDTDMDYNSSHAAGPSRDSGGGEFSHTVDGSTMQLTRDGKGVPQLSGDIPPGWVQAAGWCNMDPVKYAIDQLVIAEEAKSGKNALVRSADGMFYKA